MGREVRKKPIVTESPKDLIERLLKRGPLSTVQITARLGLRSSQICGICRKHTDVFEELGTKKTDFGNSVVWKLKEQSDE